MESLAAYNMAAAASTLADYLELSDDPKHDRVMELVHKLNENYVEWSSELDTRVGHLLD